ncbi:MAG: hypothetical protein JNK02_14100 [Planctomycetes bacterium]|nr:hypothetical protein [Planctomycetota bacterium]
MLSWSGPRTVVLAGLCVLAALSLHPFPPVERACELLFVPARWARELLRPWGWLAAGEVRAALDAAAAAFETERAQARALLAAQIESALPADPALRAGRSFLVAEVLERDPTDPDLLRVRFPPGAGVEADMPVVLGEAYVGRVRAVDDRRAGEGLVELVTDAGLRVGAVVLDGAPEPAALVVGGLVDPRARRGQALLLGARHESRPVVGGAVVVREIGDGPRAARRAAADGFRLGELRVLAERGRPVLGVEAPLEFRHGLSLVAIVGGPELATAGPLLADDAYEDARWTAARVALAGDSSPRRRTRHLSFPRASRVEDGAAVAVGARFVGRVLQAADGRAVAAWLGDPALAFRAAALVEGAGEPLHLGRLISIGLAADGAVLLEWTAREDRAGVAPRPAGRARIATSSGDRGVPAGLWVGTCDLPAGPGRHILRVVPAEDAAGLLRARVRLAPEPHPEAGP